jgi:hypothetical protein
MADSTMLVKYTVDGPPHYAEMPWIDVGSAHHCPAFVEMPTNATRVSGPDTTVIKTGSGILKRIHYNAIAISKVISIFDHDEETGLPTATFAPTIGLTLYLPITELNWRFTTGLTITVPSAVDVTLLWL